MKIILHQGQYCVQDGEEIIPFATLDDALDYINQIEICERFNTAIVENY